MLINSPLPRAPQPYFHQGSSLRSNRDSDRPDRAWSKDKVTSSAVRAVLSELFVIKRQLAGLRRRIIGAGGGSSSTSELAAFVITELGHQDYVVARQLSNVRLDPSTGGPIADVGSTDIKVAKVVSVRRTIFTEKLFGDTVNYTDDDPSDIDNTRNADNGVDPTERQVCLPPYVTLSSLGLASTVPMTAQCVFYAQKAPGLTGVYDGETQLDWIEDAGKRGVRAFAKRYIAPS